MQRNLQCFAVGTALVMLMSVATDAAEVSICSIIGDPASFDHHAITLQGTVNELKETTSRRGNDYTTFKLQDPSGCGVMTFSWGHLVLKNGDHVCVDGLFETEHHNGPYVFYNEFGAKKVTSQCW
jgi:hypothetical protein